MCFRFPNCGKSREQLAHGKTVSDHPASTFLGDGGDLFGEPFRIDDTRIACNAENRRCD